MPDLVVAKPGVFSKRGIEGNAALVVEVLSPNDESREKLPFYARVGVCEVWLIDLITRNAEAFQLRDEELLAVTAREGRLRSQLGLELHVIDGPLLEICDGENRYEV